VDSATSGDGHFQTYIELRKDRAVVLVHVPDFKKYKTSARTAMTEMCWEGALAVFASFQEIQQALAAAAGAVAPPASSGAAASGGNRLTPGSRPPAGRTPTGRPSVNRVSTGATSASTAPPVPSKVEPKFAKDLPLIVGVRGSRGYECVFVGTIGNPEDSPPTPTRKNVPSHKLLVEWFGTDQPQ